MVHFLLHGQISAGKFKLIIYIDTFVTTQILYKQLKH